MLRDDVIEQIENERKSRSKTKICNPIDYDKFTITQMQEAQLCQQKIKEEEEKLLKNSPNIDFKELEKLFRSMPNCGNPYGPDPYLEPGGWDLTMEDIANAAGPIGTIAGLLSWFFQFREKAAASIFWAGVASVSPVFQYIGGKNNNRATTKQDNELIDQICDLKDMFADFKKNILNSSAKMPLTNIQSTDNQYYIDLLKEAQFQNDLSKINSLIKFINLKNDTKNKVIQDKNYQKQFYELVEYEKLIKIIPAVLANLGYTNLASKVNIFCDLSFKVAKNTFMAITGAIEPIPYLTLILNVLHSAARLMNDPGSAFLRNQFDIESLIRTGFKSLLEGQDKILEQICNIAKNLKDINIKLNKIEDDINEIRELINLATYREQETKIYDIKSELVRKGHVLDVIEEEMKKIEAKKPSVYAGLRKDFRIGVREIACIGTQESGNPLITGFNKRSLSPTVIVSLLRENPEIAQNIALLPQIVNYLLRKATQFEIKKTDSFRSLGDCNKSIFNPVIWQAAVAALSVCINRNINGNDILDAKERNEEVSLMIDTADQNVKKILSYYEQNFLGFVGEVMGKLIVENKGKIEEALNHHLMEFLCEEEIGPKQYRLPIIEYLKQPSIEEVDLSDMPEEEKIISTIDEINQSDPRSAFIYIDSQFGVKKRIKCQWGIDDRNFFDFLKTIRLLSVKDKDHSKKLGGTMRFKKRQCKLGRFKITFEEKFFKQNRDKRCMDFSNWRDQVLLSNDKNQQRKLAQYLKSVIKDKDGEKTQKIDESNEDFLRDILSNITFSDFAFLICQQHYNKLKEESIKCFVNKVWSNSKTVDKLATEINFIEFLIAIGICKDNGNFDCATNYSSVEQLKKSIEEVLHLVLDKHLKCNQFYIEGNTYNIAKMKQTFSRLKLVDKSQHEKRSRELAKDKKIRIQQEFSSVLRTNFQEIEERLSQGLQNAGENTKVRIIEEAKKALISARESKSKDNKTGNEDITSGMAIIIKTLKKDPVTIKDMLEDRDKDGNTQLHLFCQRGDDEGSGNWAKALIMLNANVHAKNNIGFTPLHFASLRKITDISVVKFLHKNGARINARTHKEYTPLHLACMHNKHKEVIEFLISNGADIEAKSDKGATPLHVAIIEGIQDAVKLLVKHGASVNTVSNDKSTPLHSACQNDNHMEIIEFLITNGADIEAQDNEDATPLHTAIVHGCPKAVETLLANEVDMNAPGTQGMTPLHLAIIKGSLTIVKLLLDGGAAIESKNKYNGWTALHTAAYCRFTNILIYLLENGSSIEALDKDEHTALHLAASRGHAKNVEILLKWGADLRAKSKDGITPAQLAINKNFPNIAEFINKYQPSSTTVPSAQFSSTFTYIEKSFVSRLRLFDQKANSDTRTYELTEHVMKFANGSK